MLDTGQPVTIEGPDRIVTIGESVEISEKIRRVITSGYLHIHLDLSETSEISGSFAGFLTGIINRLHGLGGDLAITGASPEVERVLELVGFYGLIKVD
jgi:anti-anti-sigma regulatory factor